MSIKKDYLAKPFEKFWLLNTDGSSLTRPFSPTLPQRHYVYKPNNQIKGNKPVEIGYEFSTVGLSARPPLYGVSAPAWNPPLSMRLIPFDENKNSFTAKQVNDLLNNQDLPFHKSLTVNTLDSKYASPEYIADTYAQPNLVNIIRMASNRNVWTRLTEEEKQERRKKNKTNKGAFAVYGQVYKLNKVDQWKLNPNETYRFGVGLANGKRCIVQVGIWEDMLIRTKRGKSMKNKPFRLVSIQLLDACSGEPIFKRRRLWLGVWGKRRKELTGEEMYWGYRNRYDIEHFFRFGKQRLLLDDYQTPDEEHMQNWLEVVSMAYWMLWVAKSETRHESRKWQAYDVNFKKRKKLGLNPTPSQVQQQLEGIILSFEQQPFMPKVKIKGNGRKVGQTLPKRERYPVLRKKKT